MTLHFLGNIGAERVEPVLHHVGREAAGLAPFRLDLGAVRPFPTPRRPRVVVLGLAPEAPVVGLAAAVERGVVAAGFAPEERRFRPHLTLGRLRDDHFPAVTDLAPVRPEGGDAPVTTDVNEVVLFRSEPARGGSHYTPLGRMPLGGTNSSQN